MTWSTRKNSTVSFALNKATDALGELKKLGIPDEMQTQKNLAEILTEATDVCRGKINNFPMLELKDKILVTSSILLETYIILLRLLRQVMESGLTVEIKDLMEKSGFLPPVNEKKLCVT